MNNSIDPDFSDNPLSPRWPLLISELECIENCIQCGRKEHEDWMRRFKIKLPDHSISYVYLCITCQHDYNICDCGNTKKCGEDFCKTCK